MKSTLSRKWLTGFAALSMASSFAYSQTAIPVPNGDFSNPANAGSIGGQGILGVITINAPRQQIGTGPWQGSSTGALNLLLAPVVTIGSGPSGTLNFSGVLTANVLGLVRNSAEAYVSTGVSFQPDSLYTLTFDFASTDLLTVDLLAGSGFQAGLTAGGSGANPGTIVASSFSSDPGVLDINLLSANAGTGTLTFSTVGGAPAGDIGVYFGIGQDSGLLSASVLNNLTIDNIALTVTAIPEPSAALLIALGPLALLRRKRATV